MKFWSHFHHPQAAMALLRLTLAVLLLLHGWAKLRHGIGGIEQLVQAAGAPGWLAYAVYLGEVVAPLLLLVGLWVVPAALVVAAHMVVAFVLVHTGQVLQLQPSGGWALELQAWFFVCALVVALGHAPGR